MSVNVAANLKRVLKGIEIRILKWNNTTENQEKRTCSSMQRLVVDTHHGPAVVMIA